MEAEIRKKKQVFNNLKYFHFTLTRHVKLIVSPFASLTTEFLNWDAFLFLFVYQALPPLQPNATMQSNHIWQPKCWLSTAEPQCLLPVTPVTQDLIHLCCTDPDNIDFSTPSPVKLAANPTPLRKQI